jgi:hypothetical protein
MLMAILYRNDQVLASAYACDQHSWGNIYWTEIHCVEFPQGALELDIDGIYETAYVSVADPDLRERLLNASRDEGVDLEELTQDLEASVAPKFLPKRAA